MSAAELGELARLYGIQTSYTDAFARRKRASRQALLSMLGVLGAPVQAITDVPEAIRHRRHQLEERMIEPVVVVWDPENARGTARLTVSARASEAPAHCVLRLESGDELRWIAQPDAAPSTKSHTSTASIVRLPAMPAGYHRLAIECGGRSATSFVIAAPRRAYARDERQWGVFLPLYALHSANSWGVGDLTDLERLLGWVQSLGGDVVATLPLTAAFLDEPFEPSPYAPASRLFWNELYLDVDSVPELASSAEARSIVASPGFRSELESVRSAELVDHQRSMALKRSVLEPLARRLWDEPSSRRDALEAFAASSRAARDYAAFRAATQSYRMPWQKWPQPHRDGKLGDRPGDGGAYRYHLYVQWLFHQQLETLSRGDRGSQLYFDLPLGVHPAGYDVWRERDAFVQGASGGAPPDVLFPVGQDWGFPPLHPERIREQEYAYPIACLRHLMRHAGLLRIDHVMGLHRLYCIPPGMDGGQGVYLRYKAEELYAILSLESHRNGTVVIGEDLGTVPSYVRATMRRHGLLRTYVAQFELLGDGRLPDVPRDALACVNTHDVAPFAAFWAGEEVDDRAADDARTAGERSDERARLQRIREAFVRQLREGGWFDDQTLGEGPKTEPCTQSVLRACLSLLAASDARVVVATLEDLWGETELQNLPGTSVERPNWRRKAEHGLEMFQQMTQVTEVMGQIHQQRTGV